ncbi:hypothetical protein NQ318_006895 [Aromia moschata]|uniref:JmjC domain-containing protein n=1 Tax=Aromia moschata TaxID=1265417 RepID=A0AAV8YLM0_9CUCU|nr:hypothetical protein NQ318_006895 [Aromia moschata]
MHAKDWFHSSCCNFQEYLAIEIDKVPLPKVCSRIRTIHNLLETGTGTNSWDENASSKPELCTRHFTQKESGGPHADNNLRKVFKKLMGSITPVVIDSKDGLDMTMPPDNFSLHDVESYVGGDKDQILNRTRVFNVVSLEFSSTGLANLVEAPFIARKLDWVNSVWPPDFAVGKPQVQKYCLMSVKDSYTDFHIDFGGTSVWYHVLREKKFYFIKPTPSQSDTLFSVDDVYKSKRDVFWRSGQTMLIPTGWIYAVYTPVDSLVFGGNFLHSL